MFILSKKMRVVIFTVLVVMSINRLMAQPDRVVTPGTGSGTGGVPTTRQIITGYGLIGGGMLNVDRTIKLDTSGAKASAARTGLLGYADWINFNTGYSERRQWDGGATNLVAATGRASLGLGTMSMGDSTLWLNKLALKLNISAVGSEAYADSNRVPRKDLQNIFAQRQTFALGFKTDSIFAYTAGKNIYVRDTASFLVPIRAQAGGGSTNSNVSQFLQNDSTVDISAIFINNGGGIGTAQSGGGVYFGAYKTGGTYFHTGAITTVANKQKLSGYLLLSGWSNNIPAHGFQVDSLGNSTALVNFTTVGTATFQQTISVNNRVFTGYGNGIGFDKGIFIGPSSFSSVYGEIYTTATDGLTIIGKAGSTSDVLLANGSGGTVLTIPTGTNNVNFAGAIITNGLSTFDANAGRATIGSGDSVRVTVTGLTIATGVPVVSYKTTSATPADTTASWDINAANTLTLRGKFGWTVGWAVMKK